MAKENKEPAAEGTAPGGMVGKITVGSCGFARVASRAKADNKEFICGDIVGLVSDVKEVTIQDSRTGEAVSSLAFLGSFEAINAETGEVFQSGVCYLPSALSALAVQIARSAQELKEKGETLKQAFAVRLVAFPAQNPVGYSYKCQNLAPQASVDPLAAVKAAIAQAGNKPLAITEKK